MSTLKTGSSYLLVELWFGLQQEQSEEAAFAEAEFAEAESWVAESAEEE